MNSQDQMSLPFPKTRNVPSYKTIAEQLSADLIAARERISELESQKQLDVFQQEAWAFQMPSSMNTEYLGLGLAGESGEVASLLAKAKRDGVPGAILVGQNMSKELGDVLWFVAGLATFHGLKLSDIAQGNINKLTDRKARGVLGGSGDNR